MQNIVGQAIWCLGFVHSRFVATAGVAESVHRRARKQVL